MRISQSFQWDQRPKTSIIQPLHVRLLCPLKPQLLHVTVRMYWMASSTVCRSSSAPCSTGSTGSVQLVLGGG